MQTPLLVRSLSRLVPSWPTSYLEVAFDDDKELVSVRCAGSLLLDGPVLDS